jgi:hypothetical protein
MMLGGHDHSPAVTTLAHDAVQVGVAGEALHRGGCVKGGVRRAEILSGLRLIASTPPSLHGLGAAYHEEAANSVR